VVFDCAARFAGVSLNDHLLQGPDLTNGLLGVLLRFRRGRVASSADIKAMYHQVRVDPKDWDALTFLCWPNDDYTLPPADYQMMVHLFGAKSSPACASYALRKITDDNETHASQETLETVRDSFYVDDCLKSVDDVDVAIRLVKELDLLFKSGGFHLSKYVSNCRSLLSEICESDLSPTIVNLDLDRLPVNKTLGVFWNTDSDNLK